MTKYWKVQWTDSEGNKVLSSPISKWTDAEMYRREIAVRSVATLILFLSKQ